jgi:hypothetical protein
MQYLDLLGLQQLWTSAKAKFASKGTLANSGITDGYSSIETGTVVPIRNLENGILANIVTGSDNHKIKTQYVTVDNAGGLATTSYVDTKVGAVKVPAYTLTKSTSTDYAAVYHLQKDGANVGEAINIPKDMVVESGKVVWGSYADGTFTPATDKKNATPYVELTLANSTANKIYIAVADLVNEHKAGTGISITNNTDGTRTIAVTSALNTAVNAAVKAFGTDAEHPTKFIAKTNSGTVDVFKLSADLGWTDIDSIPTLEVSSGLKGAINDADTLSKTNKTNLEALTKRVDGIVATGGEANQNAYSNIKVGSTTLAATSKTDTVAFAGGTNISVAGSTAGGNKSVSFSHAVPTGAAAKTAGFYKFATDSTGHATSLTAVAASDITALIGAHSLTLSKTNAENDTAAITIGSTSYTVGPIPLGESTNPAKDTVRYILNN